MASAEPVLRESAAPASPSPAAERASFAEAPRVELDAHYYDPRRSQPVPVRVFASETRLRVSGAAVDVECALAAARIAPPVLGATLDGVLLPSGAKIETADKAAIERLRQLSGRPVPFGRIHRAEQSWPLAILATLLVVGALVVAYVWAIPVATLRIARASPGLAQRIGHGTLALLDVELRPSELGVSERERLQGVFASVAAEHPGRNLKLEFRKAGVANAFSLPDGTVVLTDEIVQLSQHDDQLLGVLYHEAGHVVHGHGLRRAVESSVLALLATAYYGDADQVTAIAAGLPLAYARSHYSREEELEADAAAFDGLRRHGKDPRHFARMLQALERAAGGSDRQLQYLSSHPATSERVRRFEATASP
ncbi:MAG TPA: M48 family metallopeptidase [Polyangiaceae bacterium]|nr:M48 family metallopeptidase [Polyangiaceae bacterium]